MHEDVIVELAIVELLNQDELVVVIDQEIVDVCKVNDDATVQIVVNRLKKCHCADIVPKVQKVVNWTI